MLVSIVKCKYLSIQVTVFNKIIFVFKNYCRNVVLAFYQKTACTEKLKTVFCKKIFMKMIIKTIAVFTMVAFGLQATAQSEEETKKWMEYSTPSEIHKMLAASDGEWKEDITFWMAPGAPESKMKASCVNKMVLGGRYQESRHTGDFMGMPFEGIGTLAYDNARKVFINTWIDNMGTGIMYLEGTWDAKTKTVNLSGKMTDPMTGKETRVREEFKIIDDNTQEMTQYTEQGGKEFKNMHIKITR